MLSNELARAPALLVLAAGVPVRGAFAARVRGAGWHGCDTFSVRVALSADPAMAAPFWAEATNLAVDVQLDIGFGFTSVIEGVVDSVTLDPIQGVAHLSGRDRSAALMEARTQETFANRTSSEIAALLAGRHGLAAVTQPTTTLVGRYWQLEHDRITLDQFSRATTEWDLLAGLADREGFDVWVAGSTLHFQPRPVVPGAVLRPVATLAGLPNVTSLRLERAHTLARGVSVTVKSWSSRMGQLVTHTEGQAGADSTGAQFHFVQPDLTADTAQTIARQRLAELASHELVVNAEMPGELDITARGMVLVEGTGTIFDRSFLVDEVTRSIDARGGFRQMVRARSSSSGLSAY